MPYKVHLTMKSRNAKTGPIPVSTTEAKTCPDACPLKGAGCYAELGPLGMHWQKVSRGETGDAWPAFVARVAAFKPGTLWRHNAAGDLCGDGLTIDGAALMQLVAANAGKRGFTYTHYNPAIGRNAARIAEANASGFTINLSANNLRHADALAGLGIGPVVTVLPADAARPGLKITTAQGRKVTVCPATYRDDVTCKSCGLCAIATRETIIGFPAHGVKAKRADLIARGGQ